MVLGRRDLLKHEPKIEKLLGAKEVRLAEMILPYFWILVH